MNKISVFVSIRNSIGLLIIIHNIIILGGRSDRVVRFLGRGWHFSSAETFGWPIRNSAKIHTRVLTYPIKNLQFPPHTQWPMLPRVIQKKKNIILDSER